MSLSPNRVIAFMRNGDIKPVMAQVRMTPVATKTAPNGSADLIAANVTAFTVTNPNPFAVWYKGWIGAATPVQNPFQDGNYIAPGATITQSSTRPDYISAVPADSLLGPVYAADGVTPAYDMTKAHLVFVFGSGL